MDSITVARNHSPLAEIRCHSNGEVETEFFSTLTPFLTSGLVVEGISQFFSNLLPEGVTEKHLVNSMFGIADGKFSDLKGDQQYDFFKAYGTQLLNNIHVEGCTPSMPPLHDSLTLPAVKQLAQDPNQVRVAGVQQKLCVRDHDGRIWILKHSPKEFVLAEQCGMLLSTAAGIETAEHRVFELKGGHLVFECARFDIDDPRLIVDCCQLFNLPPSLKYLDDSESPENFLNYSSYESLGAELMLYAKDSRALMEEFFHRVVFAYLIGNDDLHLKNISFYVEEGLISGFTPQYDSVMIEAINPHGIRSMALDLLDQDSQGHFSSAYESLGYYSRVDFLMLADSLDIDNPERIIDQIIDSVSSRLDTLREYPLFYSYIQSKKRCLLK